MSSSWTRAFPSSPMRSLRRSGSYPSLPIMFLGNTTSDADHTGGNAKLFQAGGLAERDSGFCPGRQKKIRAD